MSEQVGIAHLQEQMNKVKRTMNQLPYIVFVLMILGGISLAAGSHYGPPWSIVGISIGSFCTALSVFLVRYAKEQYNELFEQLKGLASPK